MKVKSSKSEVVHFRKRSKCCTNAVFRTRDVPLKIVPQYTYLGLVLNEHLDFSVTAAHVAKTAGRGLGVLIAKSKAYGGVPFACFSKLFLSVILALIHYGFSIWGHKQYTYINAIHSRTCR